MPKLFDASHPNIPKTLLVMVALQIAGCSPRRRSAPKNITNNGVKLFSEHDNAKAAIELRNAVQLKKDLAGAWKILAQIDETSRNWSGVASDMRALR